MLALWPCLAATLSRAATEATAQVSYTQARDLLAQSKALDARYGDTDTRLAELLRLRDALPGGHR